MVLAVLGRSGDPAGQFGACRGPREMIVEIDAEHVRPGSPRAYCAAYSRHDLSVPDTAALPVSAVLAVPFVFRLSVAGPGAGAVVRALTVTVTGLGTGTGRIGHRDGRADVRVRGGWPPLDHRSGRGRLPGTRGGTTGGRGGGRAAGGRGGGVTASAAAVRRRHRRRGRGDPTRGGRESDDAGQHDDHDGGHRDAGVGEDRAALEPAAGGRLFRPQ